MVKNTHKAHEQLVYAVCEELGQNDKAEEIAQKLLNSSYMKVKKSKGSGDKPKRGKNAYQLFCDAKRAEVKTANPEAKMGDLSKILGGMWKALSEEEKAGYKA